MPVGRGGHEPLERITLGTRIMNAIVSYAAYLRKMAWPVDLAVFYPYPRAFSIVVVVLCLLLLAAVTAMALRHLSRFPFLATGWFWYLGTLVPVIGIVQVGSQSMADRYTYIPLTGIFIMIAWGIPALLDAWQPGKKALPMVAGAVVTALAACTWVQAGHWKDSVTLFEHAWPSRKTTTWLTTTWAGPEDQGRSRQGDQQLLQCDPDKPDYVHARNNLGSALIALGRNREAAEEFSRALELEPESVFAHVNMGVALAGLKRADKAVPHYLKALDIRPDSYEARYNLGVALISQGRIDESMAQFGKYWRRGQGMPPQ
jgi:hypothetical protein